MIVSFFLLLGLVAGYCLNLTAVISLTVLSVIVLIGMMVKMRETAKLLTMVYGGAALLFNVSMWAVHYHVAGYTWLGDFFRGFLR